MVRSASSTSFTQASPAPITVSYSASPTSPGNRSHSCPGSAAFLISLLLALLLMAASSSFSNPIFRSGEECRHSNLNSFQDIARQ